MKEANWGNAWGPELANVLIYSVDTEYILGRLTMLLSLTDRPIPTMPPRYHSELGNSMQAWAGIIRLQNKESPPP